MGVDVSAAPDRLGSAMSWAKVDDKFFAHPKVTRVSFGARGLWVTALSWCASLETDGFIPLDTLTVFASTESQQSYAALVDELVRTGLWVDACTQGVRGYQVHDYAAYNPSHKSLVSKRNREAARLRAYRNRTSVRLESVRVSRPDPSRPEGTERRGRKKKDSPPTLNLLPSKPPDPETETEVPTRSEAPADLLALWNDACPDLPRALALNADRRKHAAARLTEHTLAEHRIALERLNASAWCRGLNDRSWKADFDFYLRPGTYLHTMEGRYDNRSSLDARTIGNLRAAHDWLKGKSR
jgi:hypothetical protein